MILFPAMPSLISVAPSAHKRAASVSESRFAFAGIDFICPVSRAVSAAWAVCRCGRAGIPKKRVRQRHFTAALLR
jgi:hypothetical protein